MPDQVQSLSWLKHLNHAPGTPEYVRSLAGCLMTFPDEIWISEENLAILMGKSPRAMSRAFAWLMEHDWLDRVSLGSDSGRQALASRYRREIPDHAAWVWVSNELVLVPSCKEHRTSTSGDNQEHRTLVTRTPDVGDGTPDVHDRNTGRQCLPNSTYEERLIKRTYEPASASASAGVKKENLPQPVLAKETLPDAVGLANTQVPVEADDEVSVPKTPVAAGRKQKDLYHRTNLLPEYVWMFHAKPGHRKVERGSEEFKRAVAIEQQALRSMLA